MACTHRWMVASEPDGDGDYPAVCRGCGAARTFPAEPPWRTLGPEEFRVAKRSRRTYYREMPEEVNGGQWRAR